MPEVRRCDRAPGLFRAALQFCTTDLTDGFCTPAQKDECRCWDRAQETMKATGLSAQAVAWVYAHRQRIEYEASKWASNYGTTTKGANLGPNTDTTKP